MIRNIVFDLGNVLISFRPSEFLDKYNYPSSIKEKILADIFRSPEWKLLDDGKISTSRAIEIIAGKSTLKKAEIEHIFNDRTKIFHSIDSYTSMLPELKKQGFKLYYISNFPADIFDKVKNSYDFFSNFNGGIISGDVKFSKPDPEIYQIFFNKFNLVPDECFFIDDSEENVKSAIETGMTGFCTFGSYEISEELKEKLQYKLSGSVKI